MAVQHGVDGAFSWNPDIAGNPPDQTRTDLRAPQVRLVVEVDHQALDLGRHW